MSYANFLKIQKEEQIRRSKEYECRVCGLKPLTYNQICNLHYIRYNNGTTTGPIPMEGDHGMVVCSEECREKYLAKGLAPFRHLMIEGFEETYVIPERHIGDPFCRLESWENPDNQVYNKIALTMRGWLQNPITHGWLFLGTIGSGKTSLACCLAHEFRKREKRVKFVYGSELKDEIDIQTSLRSWDISKQREAFFDKYLKNDLLIIDELNDIDWQNSVMRSLITKLHSQVKTVVFTTNLSPNELKTRMDDFQYSRLIQMTKTIAFMGGDFTDLRKQ